MACQAIADAAEHSFDDQSTFADAMMDAGCIPAVMEHCRAHPSLSPNVAVSMRAIRFIARGHKERIAACVATNVIPDVSQAMARFPLNAVVQTWGAATYQALSWLNGADVQKQISETHGVKLLIAMLQIHAAPRVLMQACTAAANVTGNLDNKTAFGVLGGVQALVDVLKNHGDDPRVSQEVCGTLRHVTSSHQENKRLCGVLGAVAAVVESLRRFKDDAAMVEDAFGALWNMTGTPENRGRFGDCGGVEVLVEAFNGHLDNQEVCEQACGAIWNMTANNVANKAKCGSAGGVEAILSALRRHRSASASLAKQACGALCNLACNDDNVRRAVAADAFVDVVAVLREHMDQRLTAVQSCRSLMNLTCESANAAKCAAAGGVPLLVEFLRRYKDDVEAVRQCCGALMNITCHGPSAVLCASAGGAEAIVEALRAQAADLGAAKRGCWALCHVAGANDAAKTRCVAAGGPQAIVLALRKHPTPAGQDVAKQACRAIAAITESGTTVPATLSACGEAGCVEAVVDSLMLHISTDTVVENCCRAMVNLVQGCEANLLKCGMAGGIDALERAVRLRTGARSKALNSAENALTVMTVHIGEQV